MQYHDVERILRDVLSANGLPAAIQRVERTPGGWLVMLRDSRDRIISTEVPDARPAVIRAALTRWSDSQ